MDSVVGASKMLVICGAGISTASGVSDFKTMYTRNPNLKRALSKETKQSDATRKGLASFLLEFYASKPQVSSLHRWLKTMEDEHRIVKIYTMNVDGLEAAAGCKRVEFVHGRLDGEKPARCGNRHLSKSALVSLADRLIRWKQYETHHKCRIRPKIVLYGENAQNLGGFENDVRRCDLVLCLGTSLKVEPIRSLVLHAQRNRTVLVVTKEHLSTALWPNQMHMDLNKFEALFLKTTRKT